MYDEIDISKSPSPPESPYSLRNPYVHPPLRITFLNYGASISRTVADKCLNKAIDDALNTTIHPRFAPIDTKDLDYANENLSLNLHLIVDSSMTWDEWYNAALMILGFVDRYETKEFSFMIEARAKSEWDWVGTGTIVKF